VNSLLTIYVNGDPYTVDVKSKTGWEIAMLAHDEDYADYEVRLMDTAFPTGSLAIPPEVLVRLYDQDSFTTTRKEG